MKLKKKKILLYSGLGFLGLSVMTLPAFVLTACSTTSNPYAPFTNLNVTSSISAQPLNFELATNGSLTLKNNGLIPEAPEKITQTYLSSLISSITLNEKTKPTDTVKINGKESTYTIQSVLNDFNVILIANTFYSQISALVKKMITYATISQPFSLSSANNSPAQVSGWNTQIKTSPIAEELTYALTTGSGEGSNMYALGLSGLNFGVKVIPNDQSAWTAQTLDKSGFPLINSPYTKDNPVQQSLTVELTNVSLSYSWFKELRNGGYYASNIKDVDNAMTAAQKEHLKTALGYDQYKNLTYTVPLGDFVFNANPLSTTYKSAADNKVDVSVLNGMIQLQPVLVQDKDKKTWAPANNQSAVTVASPITPTPTNVLDPSLLKVYSFDNFYHIPSFFGSLLDNPGSIVTSKPIYNNINNIAFSMYTNFYLMGALLTNNSNPSATQPTYDEVIKSKAYQDLINNKESISTILKNEPESSAKVQALLNDKDFVAGKNTFYKIIQISKATGSTKAPETLFPSSSK